jgi:hypothetical protein
MPPFALRGFSLFHPYFRQSPGGLGLVADLADDPIARVICHCLERIRYAQILRDVLATSAAGKDTILNQAADLEFPDDQQREDDDQKRDHEAQKRGRTAVVATVVRDCDLAEFSRLYHRSQRRKRS